jgi:hypothetical protein
MAYDGQSCVFDVKGSSHGLHIFSVEDDGRARRPILETYETAPWPAHPASGAVSVVGEWRD